MDQTRRLDVARLWEDYGSRLLRFGGVTIVSTVVGLVTLFVCLSAFNMSGIVANFWSVVLSTPPAYYLNRAYVWGRGTNNHSASREVGPFWIMTLLGWLVSTIAIAIADTQTDSDIALLIVQIASFAALWLVKFAFLEKVLWPDSDDRVSEAI